MFIPCTGLYLISVFTFPVAVIATDDPTAVTSAFARLQVACNAPTLQGAIDWSELQRGYVDDPHQPFHQAVAASQIEAILLALAEGCEEGDVRRR
ncbi:MAG: hypothetical protein ACO3JL_21870 [Myxococcota bacterium]